MSSLFRLRCVFVFSMGLLLMPMLVWAQGQRVNITPADIDKTVRSRGVSPIPPLALPLKINQVKELLGNRVPPQTLQNLNLSAPISLTVRESTLSDRAFLVFDFPESISAHENTALFSPDERARLKVFFNAPAPGWYVFDYTLDVYSDLNLKFMKFADDQQERLVKYGKGQHQIFVTQITKPGWQLIFLQPVKGVWTFHRVEISQVK